MDFSNQRKCISDLSEYASNLRHNILIVGTQGVGKTYLAKMYAKYLKIPNFKIVEPKIDSVKEIMDICYDSIHPIVLCVENLDCGVPAVSYSILKFLEEPRSNIFIVITCRNIKSIPDTIVSRCSIVDLPNISKLDIDTYAAELNNEQFQQLKGHKLWNCITTITDLNDVFKLSTQQVEYFDMLYSIIDKKEPISNTIWKLQKFPDGTSTPILLVMRYLLTYAPNRNVWWFVHRCLINMELGRVATHATLAKFLFDYRYGGLYE